MQREESHCQACRIFSNDLAIDFRPRLHPVNPRSNSELLSPGLDLPLKQRGFNPPMVAFLRSGFNGSLDATRDVRWSLVGCLVNVPFLPTSPFIGTR